MLCQQHISLFNFYQHSLCRLNRLHGHQTNTITRDNFADFNFSRLRIFISYQKCEDYFANNILSLANFTLDWYSFTIVLYALLTQLTDLNY